MKNSPRKENVVPAAIAPVGAAGKAAAAAAAMPLLSDTQLSDLYSNCLKMSAENKINQKNTWDLNLIDYMDELMEEDETNFTRASCTIDASVKIYAHRVDSVHSHTYKVLSGLSRTERRDDEPAEDDDAGAGSGSGAGSGAGESDGEQGEGEGKEKADAKAAEKEAKKAKAAAKRATRTVVTIEANEENLRLKKLDLEFDVDPLFQKTSAEFDEGGARGMLLNHLVVAAHGELVFGSSCELAPGAMPPATGGARPVDLAPMRKLLNGLPYKSMTLCPAFDHFVAECWDKTDGGGAKTAAAAAAAAKTSEAASKLPSWVSAAAAAAAAPMTEASTTPALMDEANDFGDAGACDDDWDEVAEPMAGGAHATVARVFSDDDPTKSAAIEMMLRITRTAESGSEFGYFTPTKLRHWAGLEHWKMHKAKPLATADGSSAGAGAIGKTKKTAKAAFVLDFSKLARVDVAKAFKTSRASTTLSVATTAKAAAHAAHLLPKDVRYDIKKLQRFALRPAFGVVLSKFDAAAAAAAAAGDAYEVGEDWYDYGNANDAENFVPAGGGKGGDDDGAFMPAGGGFDSDDDGGGPVRNLNTPGALDGADASVAAGLVPEPRQVQRIGINFDRVDKRVNVKALKHGIWAELTHTDAAKAAAGQVDPHASMADSRSFSDLLHRLPAALPSKVLEDVSVPFAFICLLHLANEHGLTIESSAAMDDLRIMQ